MNCSYAEYRELVNDLLYEVPFVTSAQLNDATEQIRQYLVKGGAGNIVVQLGIGVKVITKEFVLLPKELVSRRFIWLNGERAGEELALDEIASIGMYLKGGPLYDSLSALAE